MTDEEIDVDDVDVLPECHFTGVECRHETHSDAWCSACLLGQLVREVRLLSIRSK